MYSGWLAPDGRFEEAPGTALHVTLLQRFGERTKEDFFAKGAVRYVDATDHISLELHGSDPIALRNALDALATRWAARSGVDVEFLGSGSRLASNVEIQDELRRRLHAIPDT